MRVYIERPLANPSDADLDLVASEAREALADKGKAVARLHAFVDREGPSVIREAARRRAEILFKAT